MFFLHGRDRCAISTWGKWRLLWGRNGLSISYQVNHGSWACGGKLIKGYCYYRRADNGQMNESLGGGLELLVTILFDIRLTIFQIGQLVARHGAGIWVSASVIFCKVSKSCSAIEWARFHRVSNTWRYRFQLRIRVPSYRTKHCKDGQIYDRTE